MEIPEPPLDEQEAIAKYLCGLTRTLDELSLSATSAVALLQERRSALISAAVTGKIDVSEMEASKYVPGDEVAA